MAKYIKTAVTEAEQFDGSQQLVDKYDIMIGSTMPDSRVLEPSLCYIQTLEGNLRIHVGDWIATGVNGERWAVTNEIFKQTYSKLPVIYASVAEFIVWCKGQNTPLQDALYFESDGFMYSKQDEERIGGWITNHQDEFARAWLDGYQIETKS